MALLAAPPPQPERLSQLLPSVKCSNCGQPVALTDLGEHVCAPHTQPPLPLPLASKPSAAVTMPTPVPVTMPRTSPSQAILARIRSDSQSSVQPPPLQNAAPASTRSQTPLSPQRMQSPSHPPTVPTSPIVSRTRTPAQEQIPFPPVRLQTPPSPLTGPSRSHTPLARGNSPLGQDRPADAGSMGFPSGSDYQPAMTRSRIPPSNQPSFQNTLQSSRRPSDASSYKQPYSNTISPPPRSQSRTPSNAQSHQGLQPGMRRPSDASSTRRPSNADLAPMPLRTKTPQADHPAYGNQPSARGMRRPSNASSVGRPWNMDPPPSPLLQANHPPYNHDPYRNGSPAPSVRRPSDASSMRRPSVAGFPPTHLQTTMPQPDQSAYRNGTPVQAVRRPSDASSMRRPVNADHPPHLRTATPQVVSQVYQNPMAYPTDMPLQIDTKSGGEAGMAGVGRRAFHAVAQAALFATRHGVEDRFNPSPAPSMDGRRANAPRLLEIHHGEVGRGTPPLSPNSTLSPHSPRSPLSQQAPSPTSYTAAHPIIASSPIPSPRSFHTPGTPRPITPPSAATVRDILSDVQVLSSAQVADKADPASTDSDTDIIAPWSPGSESSFRGLAYDEGSDDEDDPILTPSSPASAHARASALRPSKSDSSAFSYSRKGASTMSHGDEKGKEPKIPFPSSSPQRDSTTKRPSQFSDNKTRPNRSDSASSTTSSHSASSSIYSRSTAKSTGAIARAMETLFEGGDDGDDGAGTSAMKALEKLTVNAKQAPLNEAPDKEPILDVDNESDSQKSRDAQKEHDGEKRLDNQKERPIKFPTRSHTTPSLLSPKSDSKPLRTRPRICARCHTRIEDGRWVREENGSGVLCARCWKSTYLPKCQRCGKPIDTQAVSSTDGQLIGKYHRACFDCHVCHKPFPDKEFYVYEGNPFCAYHYHEANKSLCKTCGQPIEGPCAVSHTGPRYHPQCFICEYGRPVTGSVSVSSEDDEAPLSERLRCKEQLEEYWEVDGKMLCERHARRLQNGRYANNSSDSSQDSHGAGKGTDDGLGNRDSVRALKRITMFIDLR